VYVEDNGVVGEREGFVGIVESSSEEISVLSIEAVVGSVKRETSSSKASILINCSAGKRCASSALSILGSVLSCVSPLTSHEVGLYSSGPQIMFGVAVGVKTF